METEPGTKPGTDQWKWEESVYESLPSGSSRSLRSPRTPVSISSPEISPRHRSKSRRGRMETGTRSEKHRKHRSKSSARSRNLASRRRSSLEEELQKIYDYSKQVGSQSLSSIGYAYTSFVDFFVSGPSFIKALGLLVLLCISIFLCLTALLYASESKDLFGLLKSSLPEPSPPSHFPSDKDIIQDYALLQEELRKKLFHGLSYGSTVSSLNNVARGAEEVYLHTQGEPCFGDMSSLFLSVSSLARNSREAVDASSSHSSNSKRSLYSTLTWLQDEIVQTRDQIDVKSGNPEFRHNSAMKRRDKIAYHLKEQLVLIKEKIISPVLADLESLDRNVTELSEDYERARKLLTGTLERYAAARSVHDSKLADWNNVMSKHPDWNIGPKPSMAPDFEKCVNSSRTAVLLNFVILPDLKITMLDKERGLWHNDLKRIDENRESILAKVTDTRAVFEDEALQILLEQLARTIKLAYYDSDDRSEAIRWLPRWRMFGADDFA